MKAIKLAKFFVFIVFLLGLLAIFAAVYFKLPARNDTSLIGLKGIMLMILLVVNTSPHSLYSSETYYIQNKCNYRDYENSNEGTFEDRINRSLYKLIIFNSLVLSSSFFLIVSILTNIAETIIMGIQNVFMRISFYSFLIFLIMIIIDYVAYNLMLHKAIKRSTGVSP